MRRISMNAAHSPEKAPLVWMQTNSLEIRNCKLLPWQRKLRELAGVFSLVFLAGESLEHHCGVKLTSELKWDTSPEVKWVLNAFSIHMNT